MLSVLKIIHGTTVDGPGLRSSIYFAGCTHRCEGCHNPQSWDVAEGKPMGIDEIVEVLNYNRFNVTFTGGDPFFQAEEVAQLAKSIKLRLRKNNIWCYTGYRWEQLVKEPRFQSLLQSVDVLVDSPFILAQRDISLRFRGSGNQRIIDVQKSLATGTLCLMEEY